MVGRGAQGNPWLFKRIIHYLETGELLPEPTAEERVEKALRHTLLDSSNDTLDLAIAWEHEISNPAVPLFLEVFREYMREHCVMRTSCPSTIPDNRP